MIQPTVRPLSRIGFETAVYELSDDPGFVALDAGARGNDRNRFSVLASNPTRSFSFTGGFVSVDGRTVIDTPISALKSFLKDSAGYRTDSNLPFSGGAIGYVSFEGAKALGGFDPAKGFSRFPQCRFGIYDAAVIFDHMEKTASVVASGWHAKASAEGLCRRLEAPRRSAVKSFESPGKQGDASCLLPEESDFSRLLGNAAEWLRADILRRVCLARSVLIPSHTGALIGQYLSSRRPGEARVFITHEGASAMACSSSAAFGADFGDETGRLLSVFPSLAFAGEPVERAMAFISNHEEEHRRLYGGAFGVCDGEGMRLYTADTAAYEADGAVSATAGAEITASCDFRSVSMDLKEKLESLALNHSSKIPFTSNS